VAVRRIDLAYTRHTQGDLADAEAVYWSMIRDGEDAVAAANNLFVLLRSARRWDDLKKLYRAIELEIPANPDWAARLYAALLSHEEYEAGWQWYESRRYDRINPAVAPALSIPEWSGGPVKRLLVWREQGLGDEIHFARYVPELARRGIDVTLLCNPGMARLFRNLPATVVPLSGSVRLDGAFDAWCLLGSLPLRLGSPADIPAPLRITATPRITGKVGVMTSGSPRHFNDANRSMPAPAAARLLALPGAVSLRPEDTGARDFQDTADIVAGLDCVVTVDTSIAHLAGSLGKRTFVLLPKLGQDWRWLRAREDSPWYPAVRILRQAEAGDWHGLIDQLPPRPG
jgi:hypothetical protein